jgi:hypothetical protein
MDTQSKENAATAPQKEPDHFLRFCCAVTFTDIVALRECDSKEDEKTIILRALVGIVLLLVTAPLWMLLLSSMLEFPLWAAIYGGCLISMVMFLLDTAASRGSWELKGVLAERGFVAGFCRLWYALVKAALRLPFALNFSILMGTFVTLWLFHDSLENQIEKNRQQHNAPIEAEYRTAKERLYTDMLETAQNDHKTVTQERQILINRLHQLRGDLQVHESAASEARIEWKRQAETGPGRLFRAAEAKEAEATHHAARIQQEFERDSARLAELDRQLETMAALIQAAQARFEAGNAQLMVERDAKLLPARSDVLMWLQALNQLKEDEVFGKTVTYSAYSIEFFLITIEMIIFIVAFFEPPSAYIKLLRERTQVKARQIELNYKLTGENLESEFRHRKQLSNRQYELEYNAALRDLEAIHAGTDAIPAENVQPFTATTANAGSERLFDVPANDMAAAGAGHGANTCDTQVAPKCEDERYPVVGSETEERISIAEALANPGRYWVNSDNPMEIWLQAFRKQLFD